MISVSPVCLQPPGEGFKGHRKAGPDCPEVGWRVSKGPVGTLSHLP